MRKALLARLAGACLSLIGTASFGQAPLPHPCTAVMDDRQRLACYDRAFGTPSPAAPPVAAPPAEVKDEFGMSARRKLRETTGDPDANVPESISGTISKIEWRRGLFVATLDNGQVWLQSELNSKLRIDPQETVTIRRGLMGSYLLTGKQGVATRVKRLK
jgi:hypothetical protein